MMQLTQRDKRAMVLGGAVLLVALLAHYVIVPGIDRWQAARAAAAQYESKLVDLQTRLDRRDSVLQRLEAKYGPAVHRPVDDVETLSTAFPEQMQALLGSAGIGFTSIELQSVQKVRDVPGLAMVSVRVQGTSNPNQMAKFMAAAATAERIVLLDRLQMTRKDRPDQWNVSFVLSTPAREGSRS